MSYVISQGSSSVFLEITTKALSVPVCLAQPLTFGFNTQALSLAFRAKRS